MRQLYLDLKNEALKLSIAEKILGTETLLAAQKLKLQKAEAEEDLWMIKA